MVSAKRKIGFYEKYIKRFFDIVCSLLAIIVFGWLYAIIAVLVKMKLGSPVIFTQPRPVRTRKSLRCINFAL